MLDSLVDFDHLARAWVVAHRIPSLDGLMLSLSIIGRGGLIWLTIAGLLIITGRARVSMLIPVALSFLITALVAYVILRPLVHRARPFLSTPQIPVIGAPPHDTSFPSGHASMAFAGALVLSSLAPNLTPLWWMLALAIAYSRVYLGVHYPLDVLGGALVGTTCAVLVLRAAGKGVV
jgi:undecaprenyl-diphosphatase